MSDVKEPGNFLIDADAALQDALASVEKHRVEPEAAAPEAEVTAGDEAAPLEFETDPEADGGDPGAGDEAPVLEVPLEVAPPARKSPQDAVIEALVRAKQEAQEALAQTQHEAKDLLEARARIQAEFENYRKRVAKEKQEAQFQITQRLARDILPVQDNFERALLHLNQDALPQDAKNLVQGVILVSKQLGQAMRNIGITPFDSKGQAFDPTRHEAVAQAPAPEGVAVGSVLEEHQRGYLLNDTLLRPAMVVVAGPAADSGAGGDTQGPDA